MVPNDSVTAADREAVFDLRPLSVHIGAEIVGLDLRKPLASETVAALRHALCRWKVLFFRDQQLDHEGHIRFARHFGAPTPGHVVFGGDSLHPEIYSIAKHRTALTGNPPVQRAWTDWHTDITAAVNPPFASILRGAVVPPYGGDTHWTNLAVAYQHLSPALRGFLDGLRAVHRYSAPAGGEGAAAYLDKIRATDLAAEHPLVTVHPETSERVLFVSPSFLESIVGLTPRESQGLLELLWEHAVRSEFTVRFKWEPGSLAFWDNRATAHLAPSDIFATDFERQFYRVTLMGEVPVGTDGRLSTLISGEPIKAQ